MSFSACFPKEHLSKNKTNSFTGQQAHYPCRHGPMPWRHWQISPLTGECLTCTPQQLVERITANSQCLGCILLNSRHAITLAIFEVLDQLKLLIS
jgi:hypothetical protein